MARRYRRQPGNVTENLGNVTFIHTDGLGSPVARTDATGNVISRTRYEPYGYTANGATPTIGFTGHVNDADTGLTYMQQRYYDPVAGRFLSIDPVVTDANTGGSFNRYAYANNSPYKYVDPDCRFAVFIHWGLTFAASINSGNSIRESVGFANRAWQADFEAGSQGVTGEAVARHAMSNINQTTDQARDGNARFVEKAVASGDLGLAGHAIQDRFAGGAC
jgi:RHS repeat-associated protein